MAGTRLVTSRKGPLLYGTFTQESGVHSFSIPPLDGIEIEKQQFFHCVQNYPHVRDSFAAFQNTRMANAGAMS